VSKLVVRDGWNGADRVLVDPSRRRAGDSHVAIHNAYPSPDGRYVAYVVSTAGREDGVIEIIEVESGRVLPDRIDRTQMAFVSWRPDGRSFFYWRRAKPRPGAPRADWYKNSGTHLHVLGTDPNATAPVIRAGTPSLGLGPHDNPFVTVTTGSPWAVAAVQVGVVDYAFFVAPLARVKPGATRWRKVAAAEDGVVDMVANGDRLYALTHSAAPNYRIVSLDARSGTVAKATEFLAASDLVLEAASNPAEPTVVAAGDGLYAIALDRGVHRLIRVPWASGTREVVALPFEGSIGRLLADPNRPGVAFPMEGWVHRPSWFRFDSSGGVRELPMASPRVASPKAAAEVLAEKATAISRDGTEIPISIIRRRDQVLDGTAPAFLNGYGQYGFAGVPVYNPFTLTWVKRGGVYAICHVRGGGERGKSWHLAGIKKNKENGVDDFIACAEHLIGKRYTTAPRLTATGTSAGGTVVGGAITKRPELFQAAVLRVAVLNLLRMQETQGGPNHVAEYGDVKVGSDFSSLLASDPYHRVRDGVTYPAALITVGTNDLRVTPWVPAKFAARLQAASRARPTLLRVEFAAGHGLGSTQAQREDEFADIYSFALWQAGVGPK